MYEIVVILYEMSIFPICLLVNWTVEFINVMRLSMPYFRVVVLFLCV